MSRTNRVYESGGDVEITGQRLENCHGPRSEHVRREKDSSSTYDSLSELRRFVHRSLEDAKTSCLECHDLDIVRTSIKGAFEEYWNRIKH